METVLAFCTLFAALGCVRYPARVVINTWVAARAKRDGDKTLELKTQDAAVESARMFYVCVLWLIATWWTQ